MEDIKRLKNIEVVEKPEYADMIIDHIQFHGSDFRKPKDWHPELLYKSKLHQGATIATQMPNVNITMSPSGLVVESRFHMSKENTEKYQETLTSEKKFKIYVPGNRMVRILFDENLKQAIRSHNRHAGYKKFVSIVEGHAKVLALDMESDSAATKLTVMI